MNQKEVVMVVDDDLGIQEAMCHYIGADYDIVAAVDGYDAIQKLETCSPSVILLDINMPEMDGFEVCKIVRSRPSLKATRIVFVSGNCQIKYRLDAYEYGADDYLVKPFEEQELKAKVSAFFKACRRERNLDSLNKSLEDQVELRIQQIGEMDRMATLGLSMAQVVHNLRGPLSLLPVYAQQMERLVPQNGVSPKLNQAFERIKDTVETILDGVNSDAGREVQDIDLNHLIRTELNLFKFNDFFKYKIQTNLDLQVIPKIKGVPAHFCQVFSNLIRNAVEAMESLGRAKKPILSISSSSLNGIITIKVFDNGPGIDQENLNRIFEPLYSTKRGRKKNEPMGTGLGLPYCKRIIERYNGKIYAKSIVNSSTQFVIEIPYAASQMTPTQCPAVS